MKFLLNVAAILFFFFVCYKESREGEWLRNKQSIEKSEKKQKVASEDIPQKEFRDKVMQKEKIAEALKQAHLVQDVSERRRQASEIKKKLVQLVESWGNQTDDVQWMQDIISTEIRPLKN